MYKIGWAEGLFMTAPKSYVFIIISEIVYAILLICFRRRVVHDVVDIDIICDDGSTHEYMVRACAIILFICEGLLILFNAGVFFDYLEYTRASYPLLQKISHIFLEINHYAFMVIMTILIKFDADVGNIMITYLKAHFKYADVISDMIGDETSDDDATSEQKTVMSFILTGLNSIHMFSYVSILSIINLGYCIILWIAYGYWI